jgi:hypothetical protein
MIVSRFNEGTRENTRYSGIACKTETVFRNPWVYGEPATGLIEFTFDPRIAINPDVVIGFSTEELALKLSNPKKK